ncbi:MAG TPA: MFS transporter [Candidatus Limnocylindrales bacterium]|nr:MFS transporter [Candidatus Limnocylindrales bacterium]
MDQRHRDRLLSLKYSTIEACFSVPMLNLTLPSFPFVLAFAVKGLGWQSASVGLMAALPHVCNCLQPLLLAFLSRYLSNYGVLLLTFVLGGVPWMAAAALPWLGESRNAVFIAILLTATCASSVASVAWSSAISELVPERLGARYFARRNLIFGAWTLLAVLVAGQIAQWQDNSLKVFGAIFCAAGLSRLVGLFFLTRMKFPPIVRQKRSRTIATADLLVVFRNHNYLWLCAFIGFWGLLLNAAMPFYTVFLVDRLNFGIGSVVKLTTVASLGGLMTLKGWGRLCERFGNRPVLQICALIWGMTALLMWSLARPGWTWHLYPGYFVIGAMTAGFQLMQFNLMVRLAPAQLRPAYVAVFMGLTSLFTAFGPILGGQALKYFPEQVGNLFGHPVLGFHLLFALSGFGCVLVTNLVQRVREPAEQPVVEVWREMKTMRTFNPMLSVLAAGELMLTPRGLFALGQRSLRTVRQQVKAIEAVGEELVHGGREVLGRGWGTDEESSKSEIQSPK